MHFTFTAVFLEGIFSFFSPCILPILPLYMSYLSGQGEEAAGDRLRLLLHTICFVLGISAAFFLLGAAFTAIGSVLREYQSTLNVLGGIFVVCLGLLQLGFIRVDALNAERRLRLPVDLHKMNGWIAFLLGFSFSFAWTPCIGPMLSSVLILASGIESQWIGYGLILLYALGFVIPFLLLGLFTARVLQFLQRYQQLLQFVVKLSGVLLIVLGILMATGYMNQLGSYLSPANVNAQRDTTAVAESAAPARSAERSRTAAFDFQLTDQYGTVHQLSDYKGKVVFLNFWATWCPPCRQEMPHIEALYQAYQTNQQDLVILALANPKSPGNRSQDVTEPEIKAFLQQNQYNFPVLFDHTGNVFADYAIRALPTTFIIDREGKMVGYVAGALSAERMKDIVEKALQEGKRENGTQSI